ncbi:MAG: polyprenyl synthetase family protein [Anaerolineales bacterium]|nr:polyprenyl synthetase family protein [Anaerolineales bacterium]
MDAPAIKTAIFALPEITAWPEAAAVFERTNNTLSKEWELPGLACEAVSGGRAAALPAAAALAAIQLSIVLVDDMLDADPRGDYHTLGPGPTANLALALQAAAFQIIQAPAYGPAQRADLSAWLAHIGLGTALGQYRDANNAGDEAAYWQVVRGKSVPFYGAALALGAVAGGAAPELVSGLNELGGLIGETAQIYDDLSDALHTPARPDWGRPRNNLPLLYALTAQYPDRARFADLLPRVADPEALAAAQKILITSGAVSYCAYHANRRYRAAQALLASLPLPHPRPLTDAIARQGQPLVGLFQAAGVPLPTALAEG